MSPMKFSSSEAMLSKGRGVCVTESSSAQVAYYIVGSRHRGTEEKTEQVLFGGAGWESWCRTNRPCQTHTVSTLHRHAGPRPLRRESRFLGGWILQLPNWLTEREIRNARLLISPSWQTEGTSLKYAPWQAAPLQQCHGRTGQTFPNLSGNSLLYLEFLRFGDL